jgi:hypothetical protein
MEETPSAVVCEPRNKRGRNWTTSRWLPLAALDRMILSHSFLLDRIVKAQQSAPPSSTERFAFVVDHMFDSIWMHNLQEVALKMAL